MSFRVEEIVRRGWFNDRVRLVAVSDILERRQLLRKDSLGVPSLRWQELRIAKGEEHVVSLPTHGVREGQIIPISEVVRLDGFAKLWREVASL